MYKRPPRLLLTNLDTLEALKAQFNPAEFELGIKAVYNKSIIPGMSHTLRQFSHTDDLSFKFELTFRVTDPKASVKAASASEIYSTAEVFPEREIYTTAEVFPDVRDAMSEPFSLDDRIAAEQFLLSLTVPRGETTIERNSPPTVLVVWPDFLSFEAIVSDLAFKYTRFNASAQPTELVVGVQMEEMRDVRYSSLDARVQGFQRSSGGLPEEP